MIVINNINTIKNNTTKILGSGNNKSSINKLKYIKSDSMKLLQSRSIDLKIFDRKIHYKQIIDKILFISIRMVHISAYIFM